MQVDNNILKFENFIGKIHILGVGGIGMSGIAEILHDLGFIVQGSDMLPNENILRLEKKDIKIFIGHNKDNINGVGLLVLSTAVKFDNVEYLHALEMGIPIIQRSEMLSEIMKLKTSIAISGCHGKTTTTSLVASMIKSAGLDPTVINGGIINTYNSNAYLGRGNYIIVEADESDGTFIRVPSDVAIVTSIDADHLDYYKNFENLKNAFISFLQNIPFYGFGIVCIDDEEIRNILSHVKRKKIITYSIQDEKADLYAFNIVQQSNGYEFDIRLSNIFPNGNREIKGVFLPIFGEHNILNSLSAISLALMIELEDTHIINGFRDFLGVKRRFTKAGYYNHITIIDDYAHHPKEIKATLSTAVSVVKKELGQKVIAVVQPHRYSRLANLMHDYCHCFENSDILFILNVYGAGEKEIEGVNSAVLVSKIKENYPEKQVYHIENEDILPMSISRYAKPYDIVLFMGAGNVTKLSYQLAEQLELIDMKISEGNFNDNNF
jgi:UDP-N-acetylmuramate--alanine ligase